MLLRIYSFVLILIALQTSINAVKITQYMKENGIKKFHIKRSILDDFISKEKSFEEEGDYKRIGPKYFCHEKDDEGRYEHSGDCQKYWHCLYVGTIFEIALERKCPVGTMFHPLNHQCEISTLITCSSWRKSIYGEIHVEPDQNEISEEYQNNYYLNEFANKFTKEYYEKLNKFNSKQQELKVTQNTEKIRSNKIFNQLTTLVATTKTTRNTDTATPMISTTIKTTPVEVTTSNILLTTTRNILFEPVFIKSILETNSSVTTEKNTELSALDELLVQKIGHLKSNQLNKTQISDNLNVIKFIFELKNRSMIEYTTTNTTPNTTSNTPTSKQIATTNASADIGVLSANRLMRPDENIDQNDLKDLDWNLLLDFDKLKALNEQSTLSQTIKRNPDLNQKPQEIYRPDLARLVEKSEINLKAKQMAASNLMGSSSVRPASFFNFSTLFFFNIFLRFLFKFD